MLGKFNRLLNIVGTALKLRSYRQQLIASNIANVDTPGYRRKDIPFEKIMERYLTSEKRLKTTNPRHFPFRETSLQDYIKEYEEKSQTLGTPNNVNLEEEMANLTQNKVLYEATLQALYKELQIIKTAINEGGGR
jgi:flagellar basal-body rod protein FlgB